MCGIAGIIASAPLTPLQRARLEAAAAALHHRGPDDAGIALEGQVGFVHTRLSIIDLAGGHQPIATPDGRLSGVVNGEIYNYVELRDPFIARNGYTPLTHSDSESALQVLFAEGIDGFKRLNGMFALAIHEPGRRRVVLARDRLGIKPLYYSVQPGFVAFGSELKAVLALLDAVPAVNPDAVAQFLEHEFQGGEDTAFAGIRRVPPGVALSIDYDLTITRQRWWSLTDVQPEKMDQPEAERRFSALMEQVMTEHMRADVPFGLFLSGGVDSSLLCALLTRMHGQAIESFSVGYSVDRQRNELDAAQTIARRFGTRHTSLEITPEALLARIPHAIWSTDELMRDYAVLPTSMLAERTRQSLKVVFTGEGGDEVFAGYARYRKLAIQRWAANLVAPGSGGFRTQGRWPRGLIRQVFAPALRAAAGGFRQPQIDAWRAAPRSWSALQKAQHNDLVTALPDNLLVKVDRSLMAFGVEGRVPYLDHRIVEFGLALPDALKVRGKIGKHFLRQWGLQYVPHDHLFQVKKGFHVPIGTMLSADFLARLGPLLAASPAMAQWFDPAGIRAMFAAHARTNAHTEHIWGLLHFAIWHRIFVEQGGRQPALAEDPLDYLR